MKNETKLTAKLMWEFVKLAVKTNGNPTEKDIFESVSKINPPIVAYALEKYIRGDGHVFYTTRVNLGDII